MFVAHAFGIPPFDSSMRMLALRTGLAGTKGRTICPLYSCIENRISLYMIPPVYIVQGTEVREHALGLEGRSPDLSVRQVRK